MHRSIVIPKGTIIPEKTTVVRIPITIPANTTPLMVVNRQSSNYKPSDTQEIKNANLSSPPNQQMYESQGKIQLDLSSRGRNRTNMNQILQGDKASCDCNPNNGNKISENLPNPPNLVAYCTDQLPETNDNIFECECEVDNEVNDPNDVSDDDDQPCFCDAYALCKTSVDESASQYIPCPSSPVQDSSNTRNFYNKPPNATFTRRSSNEAPNLTNTRGPLNVSPNVTYNNGSNVKQSSKYDTQNATYGSNGSANRVCECKGDLSDVGQKSRLGPQDANQYIPCPSNNINGNNPSYFRGSESQINDVPDDGSDCPCSPQAPCKVVDDPYNGFSNSRQGNSTFVSPQRETPNAEIYYPMNVYNTQYSGFTENQADSTFASSDEDGLDCLCSPQAACKYIEEQYNDFLDNTQVNSTSNNTNCFCGPQESRKINGNPYNGSPYSPQANSTFVSPQRQAPNGTFVDRSYPMNDVTDDGLDCLCSPQAPCKDYNTQYSDSPFSSFDEDVLDCLCSPQAACNYSEEQYNTFLGNTQVNYTISSNNAEINCSCTPQAVTDNQYIGSPNNLQGNPPQRQAANATNGREQRFRQICKDEDSGRVQNSQLNNQYSPFPPTSIQDGATFNEGSTRKGCPDYSPCPLNPQVEQENGVLCPAYLDSIHEEDEDIDDNEPNPNMKIIQATSRTYSRIDDGPVQGKTFMFDDPERKGVSPMVFDQLAKSILEEPSVDDQQIPVINTCTDKPNLLDSNFNGGAPPDKICRC